MDTWGRACFVQFLDTRGQAYPPLRRHSPHISLTFHHTHPSSSATTPSPSATTRHILSKIPWRLYSFSTVLNVTMPFSRAACCALSHTHIAPRKIVLTAPFFSLVLDVAICSPSLLLYPFAYHSAPLPGVKSHRKLHLARHFFNHFRCLYVHGHPPPIASSSLHAAQRHLSSNHTDFGKSPSLACYSLPWIGALLSFYFVSRQFSFQSFCMFQCVCRRRTHSAAFAPSVLGMLCFRPAAVLRPCVLICPHATPEHRRMRHIQSRNTFLIVLWHI